MGDRGPMPKRADERVRKEEPAVPVRVVDVAKLIPMPVEIPEPDQKWHNVARMLYDSLAESGQSVYYEPSDWAFAYMVCDNLSRELKPQFVGMQQDGEYVTSPVMKKIPIKGASMAAYLKAMTMLQVTEPDRRRNGVEIKRAIHAVDLSAAEGSANGVVVDMFADRESALG